MSLLHYFLISYISGKMDTIYDVALFAKESHSSPLVTLTPETHAAAINSDDEWLIDYYAPVGIWKFYCQ